MKKTLLPLLASAALCAFAGSAQAGGHAACGDVSIAEMNWASAAIIANVDKIILEKGYGCDVELVSGDTMPTFASMESKGEPDVAPELWVNAFRTALDKAAEEERLVFGTQLIDGAGEGWWIPKYISEEHGITTVEQALARPDLFPGAEDESKGALFNCPSGWNCQISTGNLFKAHGAEEKGWELVDSGSGAALAASIEKAFARNQGWLGYYWSPTSIMGKYDMVKLDREVPHDNEEWERCTVNAECEDPKVNSWVKAEVFTVVTKEFSEKNAIAMEYLNSRNWSIQAVAAVEGWMNDEEATAEDAALHFIETNEDIWSKWVSDEVAAKIKG